MFYNISSHFQKIWLSAVLIVLSEFLFVSMTVAAKLASEQVPNEVIIFFRNAFGLALFLPWIIRHGSEVLQTTHLATHFIRAISGFSAMYCYFYAVTHLPLAEAVLCKLTAPFFIPLLAWWWMREAVSLRIGYALLLGFAGVGLILKPHELIVNPVIWVALSAGVLAALAKVSVRRIARHEPFVRIVLYFHALSALFATGPMLWHWVTPSAQTWGILIAMSVAGTAGQLLMSWAYTLSPAGTLGPFAYSAVLFSTVYGWLVWGEWLDAWSMIGALLIVLAGLYAGKIMSQARL